MVLAILAAISLSAVIGEDGIIFQAKDTKNMIENETQYDSEQLASMQGNLRDNSIYSGIGLVPGTDLGGSSEGGEHGSGVHGNTSGNTGNNTGGTNTNTGGSTGSLEGGNATPPEIIVLSGEQIAASFFKTDVTIQIANRDKTQRIKYILTTDDATINASLYPSGMVKEIDIENGGTITFTKSTEYTITAYSYDVYGNKSNATTMWLKIDTTTNAGGTSGVTAEITSGTGGDASTNGWYTSNVTVRILATQAGSTKITYRVIGKADGNGKIGSADVSIGTIDTGEILINNNMEFKVTVDGEFEVMAYAYDSNNIRIATIEETIKFKRDASRPIVLNYHGTQDIGNGFKIEMQPQDLTSQIATSNPYNYQYKLSSALRYETEDSNQPSKTYSNLDAKETYDMLVIVKDNAGNMAATDIISKPALWVSNTPTITEYDGEGVQGERFYTTSNVEISLIGQKQREATVDKVTYEVTGNVTGEGNIGEEHYSVVTNLPESDEKEVSGTTTKKVFTITADGVYTIKVRTYLNNKVMTTNEIRMTIDRTAPLAPEFTVQTTHTAENGGNKYYKGNVVVKATAPDTSSFKEMKYQIIGTATTNGNVLNKNGTVVKTLTAGTTYTNNTASNPLISIGQGETFTVTADGDWSVIGYVYDKTGHTSPATSPATAFKKDTTAPPAPTVAATTAVTVSPNYFKGDITIGITKNADAVSPLTNTLRYEVSGVPKTNGAIAGQSVTGSGSNTTSVTKSGTLTDQTSFTITADGSWTVKVWEKDIVDCESAYGTCTVIKDTQGPTISGAEVTATKVKAHYTTISLGATDALSGLRETNTYYITGGALGSGVWKNKTDTSYAFEGLTADTDYTLNVVAYDTLGNASTVMSLNIHTNIILGPLYELYKSGVVKQGDYVNYSAGVWETGDGVTRDAKGFNKYVAGTSKGTSIIPVDSQRSITAGNGWRILSVDDNSNCVYLISAGCPADFYYDGSGTSTTVKTKIGNFCKLHFVNTELADDSCCVGYSETNPIGIRFTTDMSQRKVEDLDCEPGYYGLSGLRVIGVSYWLDYYAGYDSTNKLYTQYWIRWDDGMKDSGRGLKLGVRAVVQLKSDVATSGYTERNEWGQLSWSLDI